MVKIIKVGHTPDADDAFMFYAIEKGLISLDGFEIEHIVEDIEKLNKRAIKHELDITAISAHALAFISDYTILRSGGSFGKNYGPIIVSNGKSLNDIRNGSVGIPGFMTSAYLLMSLALGKLNCKEILFSDIPDSVLKGEIDYGLIIHEAQLTYNYHHGLDKLFDLGAWWNNATNGLPVPLGINVASSRLLNDETISRFDKVLHDSILYSLENIDDAVEFSSKYSRNTSKNLLMSFIKMYVNNYTVDMEMKGREAIDKLFSLSAEQDIIKNKINLKYASSL